MDPNLPGNRVFDKAVIAYGDEFKGSFDGQEYTIRNMKIIPSVENGISGLSLFWRIGRGGRVENLRLENVFIFCESMGDCSGCLAGVNHGCIANCFVQGYIQIMQGFCLGGLVGINGGDPWRQDSITEGFMYNCHFEGEVNGSFFVGGCAGSNGGTMIQCSTEGVLGAGLGEGGGCAGQNSGIIERCFAKLGGFRHSPEISELVSSNTGIIRNCYAIGTSPDNERLTVGLVGYMTEGQIVNCYGVCYAYEGMLIWNNDRGLIKNCFWSIESATYPFGDGNPERMLGLSAYPMKSIQTYLDAGWDFAGETQNGTDDIWAIDPNVNDGYPYLIQKPLVQGDGSDGNPYLIYLPEHFDYVMQNPLLWDKHIQMLSSIDLSGRTFSDALIASDSSGKTFEGVFDGNGCTIYGMKITGGQYAGNGGLFGCIGKRGLVKDLNIRRVEVCDFDTCGALVGWNKGRIQRCVVDDGFIEGGTCVGGLVGSSQGTLFQCSSRTEVSSSQFFGYVGGLAGHAFSGSIEQCMADGMVSGTDYVGGLVGRSAYGYIKECYAVGEVNCDNSTYTGGLVGHLIGGVVFMCYTRDYQLTGMNEGMISFCADDAGPYAYDWWDGQVWELSGYRNYPVLIWQSLVSHYDKAPWPTNSWQYQTTGDGSAGHPYLLTQTNFEEVLNCPTDWDKHFILTEDIALSWHPLHEGTAFGCFDGVFDGQGHKIINVYITDNTGNGSGFFGVVGPNAHIKQLGIEGVLWNQSSTENTDGCGGLFAYQNNGRIEACYAAGQVTANFWPGGFVFRNIGMIQDCYFRGNATTQALVDPIAGGLVGFNIGRILRCYACASVQEVHPDWDLLSGGLAGLSIGLVYRSFWDTDVSGTIVSSGGTGKTTEQMKLRATYEGWGDGVWKIADGKSLPRLVWEDISPLPPDFIKLDYQLIQDAPRNYSGGSGTESDPYILKTPEDMLALGTYLNDVDKHFRLDDDLDFAGYDLREAVVGYFNGTFDGHGHVIRNLNIYGVIPWGEYNLSIISELGLFGLLDKNASVSNMGVEAIVEGYSNLGGIAGENWGRIRQCYSKGGVYGCGSVGGLVGSNGYRWTETSALVEDCYCESEVQGSCVVSGLLYQVTGGLIGWNEDRVCNSWSSGYVSEIEFSSWGSTIQGGLIGFNGYREPIVENSFWDKDTSSQAASFGGTGCSTEQMQSRSTFMETGWDFTNETDNGSNDVWRMCAEGVDYPRLSWEFGRVGDFACPDGVGVEDLGHFAGRWLMDQCAVLNDCAGADLDASGVVDLADWTLFAGRWMEN
ncbi:MAG TPA: hypothetical protein PKB02_17265 [Anaerohalosphaeraceae bacterium]|nr:hypothetical protein [Anaerohalosphaeraceae bacterium]